MVSLKKLFGTANERLIKQYRGRVATINALAADFTTLSDEALQQKTIAFRERIAQGESVDSLLSEAFATVREAATRTLGLRHYDVQLIGGMVLHHGRIAEMKTGEGKTLVATLAVYLNALSGKGVHVVTVNDYLARRDAQWMSKVYNFLGLNVGVITHNMHDVDRKAAYGADITYGTNNEFGFDYLRDNMKFSREMMVQRPFNFAVIDEVDSILIDEARTPLIISGATEDNSDLYVHINALVKKLNETHYEKDEKSRTVTLNDEGTAEMERLLAQRGFIAEGESLYDIEHVGFVHHVTNALKAHNLFQAEVDYIVKDGKVIIIDEFTGRMMEGRRFSDGLHQALEAKEGVDIQNENQTLASITFQNYFRMYPKLSGMTGTALTEANEFADIYKLEVVEIPTHVPVARRDNDDIIYRTRAEKYLAVVEEIAHAYAKGQPVLVGTVSIEQSELISAMLSDRKVFVKLAELTHEKMKKSAETKHKENYAALEEAYVLLMSLTKQNPPVVHQVLNARHHAQEANIVAQAGRPKAVTIATNMAGRGTDIKLGGNAEVRISLEAELLEDAARAAKITEIEEEIERDRQLVLEAGGLYVIGTERHESRRIDNQLRGRSGRQGDPGESTFFISLEDDLMRIFGSERIDSMLQKFGLKEGDAIIHPWMNKAMERAQAKVESRNYDIRKNLLKFDDVMNDQRKVIYEQRLDLMECEDVSETVRDMRYDLNAQVVALHIPPKTYANMWDTEALTKELYHLYGLALPIAEWAEAEGVGHAEILEKVNAATDAQHQEKCVEYSDHIMRMVEKRLLLETLDSLWKDHLLSLDHLRAGIGLRAYGQRDPLNEYKQEAFTLFEHMLASLREQVTMHLAHLRISVQHPPATLEEKAKHMPAMRESRHDPALEQEEGAAHTPIYALPRIAPENRDPTDESTWGRVGRNEICPCGSGKKYKHCHGLLHAQAG